MPQNVQSCFHCEFSNQGLAVTHSSGPCTVPVTELGSMFTDNCVIGAFSAVSVWWSHEWTKIRRWLCVQPQYTPWTEGKVWQAIHTHCSLSNMLWRHKRTWVRDSGRFQKKNRKKNVFGDHSERLQLFQMRVGSRERRDLALQKNRAKDVQARMDTEIVTRDQNYLFFLLSCICSWLVDQMYSKSVWFKSCISLCHEVDKQRQVQVFWFYSNQCNKQTKWIGNMKYKAGKLSDIWQNSHKLDTSSDQ